MWGGEKGRETTVDRLFFVTRIINVFREAKLKIMTKRTYFMSFCYSLISDDFVMEVIAKSGKNGYNSLRNERGKFHTGITNSQIK